MTTDDLYTVVYCDTLCPVIPCDCNPDCEDDEGMLVYRSQRAAACSAQYQSDMYDLDVRACRLSEALKHITPEAGEEWKE